MLGDILCQPKTTAASWRLVHGAAWRMQIPGNCHDSCWGRCRGLGDGTSSEKLEVARQIWQKIFYWPDSIVRKLPDPTPVGSRTQFKFSKWKKWHCDRIFTTRLPTNEIYAEFCKNFTLNMPTNICVTLCPAGLSFLSYLFSLCYLLHYITNSSKWWLENEFAVCSRPTSMWLICVILSLSSFFSLWLRRWMKLYIY